LGYQQKIKTTIKKIPYSYTAFQTLRQLKRAKETGGINFTLKKATSLRFINGLSSQYLDRLFRYVKPVISHESHFLYFIDENVVTAADYPAVSNFTLDYSQIVDGCLADLAIEASDDQKKAAMSIIHYCERLSEILIKQRDERAAYFSNLIDKKASTLEEALQRILFINQIMWQTGHRLCGIGRLDKILNRFSIGIDQDNVFSLIKDFCQTLHANFHYKSDVLFGDTGQIIILGGLNDDGTYFHNTITKIALEVIKELKLPDPKLLLRVSEKMPNGLLELAMEVLESASGSPLFSNDDVVIPKLIDFGYDRTDAYNYCVSACWEPFIPGKALDPNNAASLNYCKPLVELLNVKGGFNDFDELMQQYKAYLLAEAEEVAGRLDKIRFRKDPYVSLFYRACRESKKDISNWGAKYNNFGVTAVGMPNLINSLMKLKNGMNEQISGEVTIPCFGEDTTAELVNDITKTVADYFATRKNAFPGKIKFGLSSPSYIDAGKTTSATPDGRKAGEPFHTHISADGIVWTQLIRFASLLDYSGNRFNGNVVDFFLPPKFISNNKEKFLLFLKAAISMGFFQMQMNIMDYNTLVAAKNNPENFKSLIVRVWGFSAFFVELPVEYQDLMIERARTAEPA
jgi:formate C-acetyltransferase